MSVFNVLMHCLHRDAFVTKRWPSLPWTSSLAIQRHKVTYLLLNKFFKYTVERVQGHSSGSEETEPSEGRQLRLTVKTQKFTEDTQRNLLPLST